MCDGRTGTMAKFTAKVQCSCGDTFTGNSDRDQDTADLGAQRQANSCARQHEDQPTQPDTEQ